MGWKNVKEHYRIKHQVRASEAGICIGSPYISDILIINFDGVLTKRYDDGSNDDILRYQSEMDADPALLKRLVQAEDVFAASIPVYTYADGCIVEKRCEVPGWPNVTNDGDMMYENMYSTDKAQVIEWAKRNAALVVRVGLRDVEQAEKALSDARSRLEKYKSDELKLEAHTRPEVDMADVLAKNNQVYVSLVSFSQTLTPQDRAELSDGLKNV
jgi:hypothetical protein